MEQDSEQTSTQNVPILRYAKPGPPPGAFPRAVWPALIGLLVLAVLYCAVFLIPSLLPTSPETKSQLTRALVLTGINGTLDRFRLDVGRYPTTAEGLQALITRPTDPRAAAYWQGPYVTSASDLFDAWATKLIYTGPPPGGVETYQLSSAGPDKRPGTDDDITNWQN